MSAKTLLLAVDVGNTSTHLGYFHKSRLVKERRFPTKTLFQTARSFLKDPLLKMTKAVIIASVVPSTEGPLRTRFKRTGVPTYLLGKDLAPPLVNRTRNPKQVGMDRLMNALAAHRLFKKEAIVIDFGTAITFDIVSKKGEYLGGVIAPGIEISLDALFDRTALLPKIRLSPPKNIIADNTADSIRAGCSYGIGGLCDRVVDLIKKDLRFNPVVIATGGYAKFMKRYCRSINKIDTRLTLKGILFSYPKI